jgi:hypothetical protein
MNWIDASKAKPSTGLKVLVCGHYKNGNRWCTTAAWYPEDSWWEMAIEVKAAGQLENVTHWMPLPEFPQG